MTNDRGTCRSIGNETSAKTEFRDSFETTASSDIGEINDGSKSYPTGGEQLNRLVSLVSKGQLPLPVEMPAEKLAAICTLVREERIRELVGYLALSIAGSLYCYNQESSGEQRDN